MIVISAGVSIAANRLYPRLYKRDYASLAILFFHSHRWPLILDKRAACFSVFALTEKLPYDQTVGTQGTYADQERI